MSWKELVDWSQQHFSHLPWRKNRTLYTTLVSEIMLQQTTVPTVLGKFISFIDQYPHYSSLAQASDEEVQIAWKGLGYYRRAKNLRLACIKISQEYNSSIPLDKQQLLSIPGIGDYTANALMAIGADRPALALDANLERILARIWGLQVSKGPELKKLLKEKYESGALDKIFSNFGARAIHESLMDLGRTFCQQRKADCEKCPLSDVCVAHQKGIALQIPKLTSTNKKFYQLDLLRIVVKHQGKYLVYRKPSKKWLEGQFEMPTFVLHSEDQKLIQYPICPPKLLDYEMSSQFSTTITKYKITNNILELSLDQFNQLFGKYSGLSWCTPDDNVATSVLKAIKVMSETRAK